MSALLTTILKSKTKEVRISRELPTVIIGERINPTGRKAVQAALQAGDFAQVRADAIEQVNAGAQVLDLNAGAPGLDEVALLRSVIAEVSAAVDAPLCLDSANPRALEAGLGIYEGKALINSVNGAEDSLGTVLPLAKEHGAAVIGLCMDADGIPATAGDRLAVADRIINRAVQGGIALADVVIDPLVMSLGADSSAGVTALETIRLVVREFGVNITLGASNISFGLPDRTAINAVFLAMAIQAGATCPITNPLEREIRTGVLGADLALGRDAHAMRWMKDYQARQSRAKQP